MKALAGFCFWLICWLGVVCLLYGEEPIKPRGRLLLREVYDLDGRKVSIEEYTDAIPPSGTETPKAKSATKEEAPKAAETEWKLIGGYWYYGEGDDWVLWPGQFAARSVPQQTFRNGNYDPDHTCDRCGTSQFVISGWNSDGTHSHTCPRCGNTWRH